MRILETLVVITIIAFSIAAALIGKPFKFEKCRNSKVEVKCPKKPGECGDPMLACNVTQVDCFGEGTVPWCDGQGGVKEDECGDAGGLFVDKDLAYDGDYGEEAVDMCVPYDQICNNQVDVDNLSLYEYDEAYCLNFGTCDMRTKRCICTPGYSGEKCEFFGEPPIEATTEATTVATTEATTEATTTAKTKTEAGPPKCSDQDKKTKNCSDTDYLCPYVECDECKPCEVPDPKLYKDGDKDFKYFKGCVKKEGCKPELDVIPLPSGTTCGPCGEKKEVDGTGVQEGCRVETCLIKCPDKKKPNSCEEISHTIGHPTCPTDCKENVIKPKTPVDCPMAWHCPMMTPEKDSCNITCVPWKAKTGAKRCDEKCEKIENIKNKNYTTCEGEMVCTTRTCQELSKDINDGFCYAENPNECPECSVDEKQVVTKLECGCLKIQCQPEPIPPCPAPSEECEEYEVKVMTKCNSPELKNPKCKDACENQHQCLCNTGPVDCPEGTDPFEKPCEFNETEKNNCLKEICNIYRDNKYWRKICIPESCKVCSFDEGAQLKTAGWNEKYCDSNQECCTRCLAAKAVDACPKSFSDGKKKRCGCKN